MLGRFRKLRRAKDPTVAQANIRQRWLPSLFQIHQSVLPLWLSGATRTAPRQPAYTPPAWAESSPCRYEILNRLGASMSSSARSISSGVPSSHSTPTVNAPYETISRSAMPLEAITVSTSGLNVS